MNYEIYAMGDANYLTMVLNAVAALGSSGAYKSIAALGLIVGILFVSIKAVLDGGNFKLQHFLVAFVLYQVMFGIRVTVIVHDVYTANSKTVGNVPWGLAFIGSMMSGFGYKSTKLMEQAFSLPAMTTDGFGGSLSLILNVRRINELGALADHGCTSTPATTVPVGSDEWRCSVSGSMKSYLKDCFGPAANLGIASYASFNNAPNAWEAASIAALPGYNTTISIGRSAVNMPKEGWPESCDVAYATISGRLADGGFIDKFNKFASSRIGAKQSAEDELNAALVALGQAGVDGQAMMLNAAITQTAQIAQNDYISSIDRDAAGAILAQGLTQRNIQWAGEATFFAHYVRPMITFFEALGYSLAPFIVFLLMLGPMGMTLAWKYFHLPLWVALWMPVMAIINFYINFVAQGKLASIVTNEVTSPSSITGMVVNSASIQDWLGTGSMLASSVPAITAALLYGGGAALSGLASRLQSGDFVQEKLPAPDVINPAAALSMQSGYTGAKETGVTSLMAPSSLVAPEVGSGISNTVASAATARESAIGSTASTLSNAVTSAATSTQRAGATSAITKAAEGSSDETVKSAYQNAVKFLENQNMETAQAKAEASGYLATGSVSGGAGVDNSPGSAKGATKPPVNASLNGSVGGTMTSSNTETSTLNNKLAEIFGQEKSAGLTTGKGGSFLRKVAAGVTEQSAAEVAQTLGSTNGQAFTQAYGSQVEATKQFQETSQRAASASNKLATDPRVLAKDIAASPEAEAIIQKLQGAGGIGSASIGNPTAFNRELERQNERLASKIADPEQRRASAAYNAAFVLGNENNADSAAYQSAGLALLSAGTGMSTPIDKSATNQGLVGKSDAVRDKVDDVKGKPLSPPATNARQIESNVQKGLLLGDDVSASAAGEVAGNADTVGGQFAAGTAAAQQDAGANKGSLREQAVQKAEDFLATQADRAPAAMKQLTSAAGEFTDAAYAGVQSLIAQAQDGVRIATGGVAESSAALETARAESLQTASLQAQTVLGFPPDVADIYARRQLDNTVATAVTGQPSQNELRDSDLSVISNAYLRDVAGTTRDEATPEQLQRANRFAENTDKSFNAATLDPDGDLQAFGAAPAAVFQAAKAN